MSHTCTPILVGVGFLVSEILLLSKTAKFPFLRMDYSPWSSKTLIDQNRLKKFMQVGTDVKCMHTNFGGCGLSGFGDIAIAKTAKFPFLTMDYSPWSSKNSIDREEGRETERNKEKGRKRSCTLFTPLLTSFSVFLLHISQSVYTYQSSAYPPTQSHSLMRNPLSQNTLGSGDRKTEKHFK